MKIDVILATYNRAGMLASAIESFLAAALPPGRAVRLYVIDNNSKDDTKAVVENFVGKFPDKIVYLFEGAQGKSHALNTGIKNSTGDIVAYFDDDEILNPDWLTTIAETFLDPTVEFIGGPVRPKWSRPPPSWMPEREWGGVLGIIDNGPVRRRYGTPGYDAMLVGGNTAIRRSTLAKCGAYSDKYTYGEDRDMYERLLKNGAIGYYVPELIVYHRAPEKRLNKRYFRQWAYFEGQTEGRKFRRSEDRARVLIGLPLWRWRLAAKSLLIAATGFAKRRMHNPEYFAAELELVLFWGFFRAVNLSWIKDKHFDRA